jgi:hypothetical protein
MRYFIFLAIQMVAVSASGKPRHPVFREYFEQKVKEGKNKPQALVCVARRLVKIDCDCDERVGMQLIE